MPKGWLPGFLRHKSNKKQQQLLNETVIDYDEIYERSENREDPGGVFQRFLSEDAIQDLVTEANVLSTLRSHPAIGKSKEAQHLAAYVVKNARKTFLTLITSDTLHHVGLFKDANFTDNNLPVTKNYSEGPGGKFVITLIPATEHQGDGSEGPLPRIRDVFSQWNKKECDDFHQRQWVFLAPTFRPDIFEYKLDPNVPLPYIPTYRFSDPASGNFGLIQKVGLLNDHHNHEQLHKTPLERHVEVAVKTLTVQAIASTTDIDKFYDKEKATLDVMRTLNHDHLIKAVAAYQKGDARCFIFPWADGGNLRELWSRDATVLDRNLLGWALAQMKGLAGAVLALHRKGTRHGDLKPENILRFFRNAAKGTSEAMGTLVIADVGLAKFHPDYTRERNADTTTRFGSRMYEPPDVMTTKPTSRRYDVWSLGCVYLEFVIWLVHGYGGPSGLHRLREELVKDDNVERFWRNDIVGGEPRVHPVATEWMDEKLRNVLPAGCPLRDLVDLVQSKLLITVHDRAYSKDVFKEITAIEDKALSHDFDACCSRFAAERNRRLVAEGHVQDPNRDLSNQKRTTHLGDVWENVTDNQLASAVISNLDWQLLRPPPSKVKPTCSRCRGIDFQSSKISLGRTLVELERNAESCHICDFLSRCLAGIKPPVQGPVTLELHVPSHSFRLPQSGQQVVSIYREPDSKSAPPLAQVGLPLLTPMASTEQFRLLNEWRRICNETHECITHRDDMDYLVKLPTRLIALNKSKPAIRLIETAEHPDLADLSYIALSHRWGQLSERQKFCTYKRNLNTLKREIEYAALPKSFQDAVRVTLALGISYLWIDSLCIVQDDGDDWEREAARMEDVFSSAYLTVAATSAPSSIAGFLGDRPSRPCTTVQTTSGEHLYLSKAIDDFRGDVEKGSLNTRGWVFQERALSRRTVHFTSTQIYWECGMGIHCETLAQLRNPQTRFLGDSRFPDYGLQFYKDERIRLVQYLYQTYCDLDLTNMTDRPKAILGIEKRLERTFKSRAEYGIIWTFFERMLLWRSEFPGGLSKISSAKNTVATPSWSWMSRAGRIRFLDIPFSTVSWLGNVQNPFVTESTEDSWDGVLHATANKLLLEDSDQAIGMVIDSQEYHYDHNMWLCVVVGEAKMNDEGVKGAHYVLIIRPVSSGKAQTYERVGAGTLYDGQISPETVSVLIV